MQDVTAFEVIVAPDIATISSFFGSAFLITENGPVLPAYWLMNFGFDAFAPRPAVSEDSKNPVYYVQYAHARICSLLRNLAADGTEFSRVDSAALNVLQTPEERELIRHIASYTGTIIEAAKDYNPSLITRYAIDLATLFHKIYNACPVKTAADELKIARISLCAATKQVLENVLGLLKITAPESM